MIVGEVEIIEREWPKPGARLFSVVGHNLHLSLCDETDDGKVPAILCRLKGKKTLEILRVDVFDDDQAAIRWMVEALPKYCGS